MGIYTEYGKSRKEQISAFREVKIDLGEQRYCNNNICWEWFDDDIEINDECPACKEKGTIQLRPRIIKGWIGVQRFFSEPAGKGLAGHYGIDLVRNGRVIEEFSKDFFQAKNKDGSTYQSYPVEGPKLNARLVGSLDISFCPTEPEKSEFDKEDKNWKAVYDSIAGRGMQPKLADEEWKDEGGFISTDLTKMVRTWGSSNFSAPFSKFLLNLVPGKVNKNTDGSPRIHPKTNLPHMNVDFSTPKKNAKMFYEGKKEWQDDEKWYQEVMDSEDWSAEQWYQNWKKENGIIDPEPEVRHGKDPQKCIICKRKKT